MVKEQFRSHDRDHNCLFPRGLSQCIQVLFLGRMSSNQKYFQREIEFSKGILTINQSYIGDVGHVVWDAAISLAKFIDGDWFLNTKEFIGKNVVELGSGTGLVGIVAAMHG